MYNNKPSPIVVISKDSKKVFEHPQNLKDKQLAIDKARKDLKKAGFKF